MYRYSGPSIYKETKSSVKHYNQVLYYFYKSIIKNSQQHSTTLWYSPKFQSIIQAQPNIYSSLYLHQTIHALVPLIELTPPLNPLYFLLSSRLIWNNLTLPPQPKKHLPVLMITMSKNMQKIQRKDSRSRWKIWCKMWESAPDLVTSYPRRK